jgi:hypothetical protein
MNELAKSLHFIIYQEVSKILDNISLDYSIPREKLNKYLEKDIEEEYIIEETVNNSENVIIVLPVISDDETLEIQDNTNNTNNTNNTKMTDSKSNLQNTAFPIVVKCKELTRKGKQCDYNAKPNSEYCGRHTK